MPKIRIAEDGLHTEIDLYLDLEFDSANNAALTTPLFLLRSMRKNVIAEKNRPIAFVPFSIRTNLPRLCSSIGILIKQIANYWNDSSLYLSFDDFLII